MRRMEIITNHRLGKNTTLFFAEANEKWRIFELYQISHFRVKRDLGTRLHKGMPVEFYRFWIGHVRYVSPRREGTTPSRGRVVAGWNFGANLESASSFSFWSLFDILFRKWYWPLQSLFISFASMETVKSSLIAKRKMGQGIFDVS